MKSLRLWHNPKCSKSRAALECLRQHGVEPEIYDYMRTPPDAQALRALKAKLGLDIHTWLRQAESTWAASGLHEKSTDDEIIAAMAADPRLIQRPILEASDRAVLARPPESVLNLID